MVSRRGAALAIIGVVVLCDWTNAITCDSLMAVPVGTFSSASPGGKYRLASEPEPGKITMVEYRRGQTLSLWTRSLPITPMHVTAAVSDDGPYAVLMNRQAGASADDFLVFLGPTGEVVRRYALGEVWPGELPHGADYAIQAYVRCRREYVLATPDMTLRAFEMPSGRPMTVSQAAQQDIRTELVSRVSGRIGASQWTETLRSDTPFSTLSDPNLPLAAAPARPQVSLPGMDLVILIGGVVGLLAVAVYCATRKHWRVSPDRPMRW